MNKERKKILFIKPVLVHPRYHLIRTKELSLYFDITWLIHSDDKSIDLKTYNEENHQIILLGKKTPQKGKRLVNLLILIKYYFKVILYLKKRKYDLVIVHNNKLCFLLPLFNFSCNFALSMGTSAVTKSKIRNKIIDIEYFFNTLFFKKIIVGTPWMIEKFNLYRKNVIITRWGTKPLSTTKKTFKNIRLLYIGTLTNRRIHETVEGLSIFLKRYDFQQKITYDIIGKGQKKDEDRLRETIKKYNLNKIVNMHGFLPDDEAAKFFDTSNIGVAYIPITDYFTNVVATKLDEYIISGLVSIATKTNENKKVITKTNGVLIDDSPLSFAKGLIQIVDKLHNYSSKKIFDESKTKSLAYKVENEIYPNFLKLMDN